MCCFVGHQVLPIYNERMHAASLTLTGLFFALTLGACEKKGPPESGEAPAPVVTDTAAEPGRPEAAPAAAARPERAAVSQGSAALKLTGAITKDLDGQIVTCGFTRLKGRDQGRTWGIRSEELDFQVIATTDEELASPAAILNVRQPARASYAFKRKAGTVSGAKDGTVTELDADLHNVVGKEVVHVKGTMTCPPR